MAHYLDDSAPEHVTTGARTNFASQPLDVVSRVYFSGTEDVAKFISDLENYISYNSIPDTKKYLLLTSSLQGDALLWLQNIGKFLVTDETQRYAQTVAELQKTFSLVKDMSDLRAEFYSLKQTVREKGSTFLLRKLELKNKLDLHLTFDEFLNTVLPLFRISLQDYIELRAPRSSAQLYDILITNESRHGASSCGTGSSVRQRGFNSELNLYDYGYHSNSGFRNAHRNFRGGNSRFQNSRDYNRFADRNNCREGNRSENRNFVGRNQSEYDKRNRQSFSSRGAVYNFPSNRLGQFEVKPDREYQHISGGSRSSWEPTNDSNSKNVQLREDQQKPSVSSFKLAINPVELPKLLIVLEGIVVNSLWDSGAARCFISFEVYKKYFQHKPLKYSYLKVKSAQGAMCVNKGAIDLYIEIRSVKLLWQFQVIQGLNEHCIIGVDFMRNKGVDLNFFTNTLVINKKENSSQTESLPPSPIKLDVPNLTKRENQLFQEFLDEFKDVFSEKPGLTHVAWHEIDTGNSDPVASKPYRYDTVKQKIIDYHINEMLADDIIMPIDSPFASPVVLCKKNNGKSPDDPKAWRFAVDYRKLNSITRYPQYPIPIIDDIFANITDTNFMSTLDLTSGYFQIPMKPDDIHKTAFITKNGCFAFKRMSFGLSGAPATFQKTMDRILKPLLGKGVLVYLDDLIVTGATLEEHLKLLRAVFTLLRSAGLTVNWNKCKFLRHEIKYLGFKITREGVQTDSEKTVAITSISPPTNAKQVSSFLGMVSWFSKFIPHFSELCEPLYALKRKRVKFLWSHAAQTSFDQLKEALISAPVLAYPNYSLQFELFCDASSVGVGAMLAQAGHPIAYASRILNSAERNYSVTERECLAVIWALHKFRCYFNEIPVKVITDHSALTQLTNGKGLSSRMVRWSLKLAEYNVQIEHRAGKENGVADALSRNPQKILNADSEVKVSVLSSVLLNSREKLIQEQRDDPDFGALYRYLEDPDETHRLNASIFEKWSRSFKLIDGLLFYARKVNSRGELCVFIPASLRMTILDEFHDNPLAGHLGMRKTYDRIRESCYFPKMRKIVRDYVASCSTCQKFNYRNISPAGKLISVKVSYPLQKVGLDLIGPYPISYPERYRYVLVIVDYFSKWVEFVPLRKASAKAVADAFFNTFISKYGTPLEIVSDHGPCFVSEIFKTLCNKLEISHIFTVPYRPQSNMSERVNRTLIQMISSYIGSQHSNWDLFLQHFAFALRTAVHETTNKTPAELFLGRKIITPFQRLVMVSDLKDNFVCANIDKLIKEAQVQINKAQKRQALYYNMHRRELEIQVGDFVLLEKHWLSSRRNKKVAKFGPKFVGPYRVLEKIHNNLILDVAGERTTVNLDQVRVYKFRTSAESSHLSDSESQNPPTRNTIKSSASSHFFTNGPHKDKATTHQKTHNRRENRTHFKRRHELSIPSQNSCTPTKKRSRLEQSHYKRQRENTSNNSFSPHTKRNRYNTRFSSKKLHSANSTFIPVHSERKLNRRKRPAPSSTISGASRKRHPPDPIPNAMPAPARDFTRKSSAKHPYRTRLQTKTCRGFSPYLSEEERQFVQHFWNPAKSVSPSLRAASSESSL